MIIIIIMAMFIMNSPFDHFCPFPQYRFPRSPKVSASKQAINICKQQSKQSSSIFDVILFVIIDVIVIVAITIIIIEMIFSSIILIIICQILILIVVIMVKPEQFLSTLSQQHSAKEIAGFGRQRFHPRPCHHIAGHHHLDKHKDDDQDHEDNDNGSTCS